MREPFQRNLPGLCAEVRRTLPRFLEQLNREVEGEKL